MNEIVTYFRQRLNQHPELTASAPQTLQAFAPSEAELSAYETWRAAPASQQLYVWLADNFMAYQAKSDRVHEGIDFFMRKKARGFRIHPALTRFSDSHIQCLFEGLKDKLLGQSYTVLRAETQLIRRGVWDETIKRYFLAPHTEGVGHFPFIKIELLFKNNNLCFRHFEAGIPNTEQPHHTDDFAALVQALFQPY